MLQETHLKSPDFQRMIKLWVGTVLDSDALDRKAGVLILIHKNLPCDIISINSDKQGRILSAHIRLGNRDLMLSNIYAPNSPGKSFFSDLSTWLLHHPLTPHIGGDFNTILHPNEDRSSPKRSQKPPKPDPTLLASTMDSLHFRDIWQLLHPVDRDFTFYSNPHNVFTRIDYLFCTDNLVPKISGADIHDIAISCLGFY